MNDDIDAEIYGLHCDIGRLEMENVDLRIENVKLQKELITRTSEQEKVIECLRQENIDWENKYCALAAENAKLRKLVEVSLRCCDNKCDGCKFLKQGLCHVSEFEDEARELGVEIK